MSEKERLVSFDLLGQNYSFYTAASEEEMTKILTLVRQLTGENTTQPKSRAVPVNKTAVMACLNLASKYIKLEQEFEEYRRKNSAATSLLIEKIDATLPNKNKR